MAALNFHTDDQDDDMATLAARLTGRTIAGVSFNHRESDDWHDMVIALDNGEVLRLTASGYEADCIAGSLK